MRYTTRLMRLCLLISVLIAVLGFLVFGRSITVYIPITAPVQSAEELHLQWDEGHMQILHKELKGGYLQLRVAAEEPGSHWLSITDSSGQTLSIHGFRVASGSLIYDKVCGSFSGCYTLSAALLFFCISFALVLYRSFFRERGTRIYSFRSILKFGMAIFLSIFGLDLALTFCGYLIKPQEYNMLSFYSAYSGAARSFVMLSAPLALFFGISLIVSNYHLLRHEGKALHNLLSAASGILIIGGLLVCILMEFRSFAGSVTEMRIYNTVNSVICTVYAYFECILFSSAVNGLRAAKHKPPYDRDFILILGCSFRKDGSLTPLLQGRADAAIRFREAQLAETGKAAILVPSGGQGSDEPMPEAEAIGRYLITQGIPEEAILKETRSTTTLENMQFSGALIAERMPDAKIAFATTNYHVFRSGIWAQLAGLRAEGIGSKTKWWFWPNAFIRECAGLLKKNLLPELIGLVGLICFFGAISMLVPI